MKKPSSKVIILVAIAVAFALAGIALLRQIRAAGPFVSTQPETGTISAPAAAISDATASGGSAIKFSPATSNSFYQAVCGGNIAVTNSGNVQTAAVVETSGVAASRNVDNVYWLHNDSGDSTRIFAVNGAGGGLGTFNISGADAIDWEDIAAGPGPVSGQNYLYIGDIGSNSNSRLEIAIYRIAEPPTASAGSTQTVSGAVKLRFKYPDGTHNSEAFFIDPLNGDIYVIRKSSSERAGIYKAPNNSPAGQLNVLTKVGDMAFTSSTGYQTITAADISPDGKTIAIRTYSRLYIYNRPAGASIATVLAGSYCTAPTYSENQGEAVTFKRTGRGIVSISEGPRPPVINLDQTR